MVPLKTRKRHDTSYPLIVQLTDNNGPRVLTDSTAIVMTMTFLKTGIVKINRAACTQLDQTLFPGQIKYAWQAADVDTAAMFRVEWEISFTDGTKATWPSDDYCSQLILEDLDAT